MTSTQAEVPTRQPSPGFSVAALILGIVSVLMSPVPGVGLTLGLVGLVLALIARSRSSRRGFAIAGGVMSLVGGLANLLAIAFVIFVLPGISDYVAHSGLDDGASEHQRYTESLDFSEDYLVSTPCYSFTGPEQWINHQPTVRIKDCYTHLEDHGEPDDRGRYVFDPELYGSVTVDPDYGAPDRGGGDFQLDGMGASLTTSSPSESVVRYELTVKMPQSHSNYYGDFDSLSIVLTGSQQQVDRNLARLIDTWRWN